MNRHPFYSTFNYGWDTLEISTFLPLAGLKEQRESNRLSGFNIEYAFKGPPASLTPPAIINSS